MRKIALLIVVLGLALAFAGCRGITTDLHDTHTITLIAGDHASVDGKRSITLETDIWGRLPRLPNPQRVEWRYVCEWRGEDVWVAVINPYFDFNDPTLDWGRPCPHQDPECDGPCLNVIRKIQLQAIRGWWHVPVWRDSYDVLHEGDPVPIFSGPASCAHHGCNKGDWEYDNADYVRFLGWFTAGGYTAGVSQVTLRTVFTSDTTLFAKFGAPAPVVEGSVAAQLADLRVGGLPFTKTITLDGNTIPLEDRIGPAHERIGPQRLYFGGREITITLEGIREQGVDWFGNPFVDESYPILQLREPGALFTVGRNVTLVMRNIQLWGFDRNYTSAIVIEDGGRVIIEDNGDVAFNRTYSTRYGGGITVQPGGELLMEGGRIFGHFVRHPRMVINLVVGGAGVWVRGGNFEMTGGVIGGLEKPLQANFAWGGGGGVKVSHGGHFEMIAGLIYDNLGIFGAGVFVSGSGGAIFDQDDFDVGNAGGTFVMRGPTYPTASNRFPQAMLDHYFAGIEFPWEGASIRNNRTFNWGGGVMVALGGRFDMHGGFIIDNDGWDGAGVHNDGTFVMHDGHIAFNDASGGAGITNWAHAEMWHGYIGWNDGTNGAGIRNWGDFFMFGGDVTGNIGNGGPVGGIANFGQFHMHGGVVNRNVSNVQSGGISHGIVGMPYLGRFIITSGQFWNNRDLTTHHTDGLPGSIGNFRMQGGRPAAVTTARLGYFSLANTPPAGWPAGIPVTVPVFDGNEPPLPPPAGLPVPGFIWDGIVPQARPIGFPSGNEWPWDWYFIDGVIPAGWTTEVIFWLRPPDPSYPMRSYNMPLAVGRPRVEIDTVNTVDVWSGVSEIIMNTDLTMIRTTDGAIADIRRGGVTFSSITTAQNWVTDISTQRRGYAWVVSYGQMAAVDFGSTWTIGGVSIAPENYAQWPSAPGTQTLPVPFLPVTSPDVLPWAPASGAAAPLAAWHAPMAAPARMEVTPESPAMRELFDQRLQNMRMHQVPELNPAFELRQIELARERREELYVPEETLRVMEEIARAMAGRHESDNDDGIVPFAR